VISDNDFKGIKGQTLIKSDQKLSGPRNSKLNGRRAEVYTDQVRICIDFTKLNMSVKREDFPLPSVEEYLAKLANAVVFSKLDANSSFWHTNLATESRPLTNFITPFGRYCCNRLPFGISSASEFFQKRMSETLEGFPRVLCHVDLRRKNTTNV
jgi:hypothetical protein